MYVSIPFTFTFPLKSYIKVGRLKDELSTFLNFGKRKKTNPLPPPSPSSPLFFLLNVFCQPHHQPSHVDPCHPNPLHSYILHIIPPTLPKGWGMTGRWPHHHCHIFHCIQIISSCISLVPSYLTHSLGLPFPLYTLFSSRKLF